MSSEHLTCGWLQQLLLVLVKLCFTFAGPLRPLIGTECTAKSPASYILVFTGHWSPQAFPKQYPLFRPPAQWSKLIGEKDPWGWKHGLLENHPCKMEIFTVTPDSPLHVDYYFRFATAAKNHSIFFSFIFSS